MMPKLYPPIRLCPWIIMGGLPVITFLYIGLSSKKIPFLQAQCLDLININLFGEKLPNVPRRFRVSVFFTITDHEQTEVLNKVHTKTVQVQVMQFHEARSPGSTLF